MDSPEDSVVGSPVGVVGSSDGSGVGSGSAVAVGDSAVGDGLGSSEADGLGSALGSSDALGSGSEAGWDASRVGAASDPPVATISCTCVS